MRNCVFCNDRSIPDAQKQHVDLKCTFASKSQKDALVKERKDRAESKRKAWQDRSKTKGKGTTGGGGAALAKATAAKAVDDADEAAARDIFNTGSPVLLDLDDLMPQGAGRSFMAKPSPLAHAPPSLPVAPSLPNIEGVTKKTAFSPVRPHIFASVECLGLYFNRTHNTQNLLLKKQRTRDICTANTLTTHHQRHTAIARGARFLHGESACRHVWHIYWPPLMKTHHCGRFS